MKVGFLGGGILLMLTLVFSYIAIQNNKLAREITINAFDVKPNKEAVPPKGEIVKNDVNNSKIEAEAKKEVVKQVVEIESKWDKFDEKFKSFDEKFKDF